MENYQEEHGKKIKEYNDKMIELAKNIKFLKDLLSLHSDFLTEQQKKDMKNEIDSATLKLEDYKKSRDIELALEHFRPKENKSNLSKAKKKKTIKGFKKLGIGVGSVLFALTTLSTITTLHTKYQEYKAIKAQEQTEIKDSFYDSSHLFLDENLEKSILNNMTTNFTSFVKKDINNNLRDKYKNLSETDLKELENLYEYSLNESQDNSIEDNRFFVTYSFDDNIINNSHLSAEAKNEIESISSIVYLNDETIELKNMIENLDFIISEKFENIYTDSQDLTNEELRKEFNNNKINSVAGSLNIFNIWAQKNNISINLDNYDLVKTLNQMRNVLNLKSTVIDPLTNETIGYVEGSNFKTNKTDNSKTIDDDNER